ncbi:hypothetical protein NQ318_010180 [Aromia moschata]|uniref:Uncharacterized protein n=1 Tax=Aromia moschata TaxID=1265417 RepID=A0AAV8XPN4_9CUCU|nr:hypothetical protein NQ318_010180 [Aromia moschata]
MCGPVYSETGSWVLISSKNELIPALSVLYPNEEDPDIPSANLWFQQDGAHPHYTQRVRNYLDDMFPNRELKEDYDAFCLAYMFTYRDFEMGTLGLAWTGDLKNAGGVCEKTGAYFVIIVRGRQSGVHDVNTRDGSRTA